tara:strand:+ start:5568 stop:6734 length:1167 start_codon:yes stop_codon:yes gene_type:complete
MILINPNVAIIHDWFLKKSLSGSEQVTILLDKYLSNKFYEPDIYSIVENISNTKYNLFGGRKINTTFIQNLPFSKTHIQNYLPLIPFAIEQLDLSDYRLIVSSSHLAAKGVLTSPSQIHISYVHTPMRYAWDQMNIYLKQSTLSNLGFEIPLRYLFFKLRQWDFISGQRPDYLLANSSFTSQRIKKYWGLNSEVIYPPVEINRFDHTQIREEFYLSVCRLVPNKRVDLLVKAFNKLNKTLFVVGNGPELKKLKNIANSNIHFKSNASNKEVENLMSKCRAFVYSGIEDFGIAPVEAMASGAPIIALDKGGIRDTVISLNDKEKEGPFNGILFKEQNVKEIFETISWFEEKKVWKKFNSEEIRFSSEKFKPEIFTKKFDRFIKKVIKTF